MSQAAPKVVFDCVIFAQAMINDLGPAGTCLALARAKDVQLAWSHYILTEIRELPEKLPRYLLITPDRIEAFVEDVAAFTELVENVANVYENPFDPDDSHYVDLAVAATAMLITSRDRHLLKLMDESIPQGKEFRRRFPQLSIVTPEAMLAGMRRNP